MSTMNINDNNEYELNYTPNTLNQQLVLNLKNKITCHNIKIKYACDVATNPNINVTLNSDYTLSKVTPYSTSHGMGHWYFGSNSKSTNINVSNYFSTGKWYNGCIKINTTVPSVTKTCYYGFDYIQLADATGTYSFKSIVTNNMSFKSWYNGYKVYSSANDYATAIDTINTSSGSKFVITESKSSNRPGGSSGANYVDYSTTKTLKITNKNESTVYYSVSSSNTNRVSDPQPSGVNLYPVAPTLKIGEEFSAIDSAQLNGNTMGVYYVHRYDGVSSYDQHFGTEGSSPSFWPLGDPLEDSDFDHQLVLWLNDNKWHYYSLSTGTKGTCTRWVYYWSPSTGNRQMRKLRPYMLMT